MALEDWEKFDTGDVNRGMFLIFATSKGEDNNEFSDEDKKLYSTEMLKMIINQGVDINDYMNFKDANKFTEDDIKHFEFVKKWTKE